MNGRTFILVEKDRLLGAPVKYFPMANTICVNNIDGDGEYRAARTDWRLM